VKGLVIQHEAKMQAAAEKDKAVAEAGEKATTEKDAADHGAQLKALAGEIITALQAKKSVALTLPDGRKASAEVTVQ